MLLLRLIVGIVLGVMAGAALGFGAALIAMSVDGSHQTDGSFGMIEVFTMVPGGAILGVLAGLLWAFWRRPRRAPATPNRS